MTPKSSNLSRHERKKQKINFKTNKNLHYYKFTRGEIKSDS